jgi:DNA transformation protein and related proteins
MTSDYTQFVLDQLTGLGRLRVRRMFGGAGIYCDEMFFAIADHDTLYLKADDTNRETYLQAGSVAFKPSAHRSTTGRAVCLR